MSGERSFIVGGHEIAAPPLEPGLYIVATPIGNLGDITIRALETLAACDVLACEDTRVTRRLLDRYGIRARPVAYHEHNADAAGPKLIAAVKEGKTVALVSDAGTPLVSDPGLPACRDRARRRHPRHPDPRRFGDACRVGRLRHAERRFPLHRLFAGKG
jgi:hypothetical protein